VAGLKEAFDVDAELVEAGGGIFDVVVDGELVFSKKSMDRFPEPGEVVAKLRSGVETAGALERDLTA
jgi:selT/selW/selH-like putative selenoprotein